MHLQQRQPEQHQDDGKMNNDQMVVSCGPLMAVSSATDSGVLAMVAQKVHVQLSHNDHINANGVVEIIAQ